MCNSCHGMGRHTRTRRTSHYNGTVTEYQDETYYEQCWNCSGGYNYPQCWNCTGSGRVSCSTCGGSGKVKCSDCTGAGRRLYRYDRSIVVDSVVNGDLKSVAHQGLKSLLGTSWNAAMEGGGVQVSDVALSEPSADGLTATATVSFPSAVCAVTARKASGEAWAVGTRGAVRGSSDILFQALELPKSDGETDWPAIAESLAGKQVVRDAMTAFDEAKSDPKLRSSVARTR